jgi:hypothetical protein
MGKHLIALHVRAIGAIIIGMTVSGCSSVAFYEKQAFSNPVMQSEPDRTETHFHQKVQYSREAAIGGIGESAGGGCGCY